MVLPGPKPPVEIFRRKPIKRLIKCRTPSPIRLCAFCPRPSSRLRPSYPIGTNGAAFELDFSEFGTDCNSACWFEGLQVNDGNVVIVGNGDVRVRAIRCDQYPSRMVAQLYSLNSLASHCIEHHDVPVID